MSKVLISGPVSKMQVSAQRLEDGREAVTYEFMAGDDSFFLNDLLGQKISLSCLGEISCTHCGRKTRKSFGQGYCYPCFSSLAQCDMCIMKPETCHFEQGTCREPDWAMNHCMTPHYVYLANSSGLKVGITRENQLPTRWIDQGAIQALPIARVSKRYYSGLIEVALANYVTDKTSWQQMLKNEGNLLNMTSARDELLAVARDHLAQACETIHDEDCQWLEESPRIFSYPVIEYPAKVKSHNLDKTPDIEGRLMGIKGQYLILDTGVINIRKYTGYHLALGQP